MNTKLPRMTLKNVLKRDITLTFKLLKKRFEKALISKRLKNPEKVNSNDGHLVRTKPAVSNVGGVNVGGACIGSITFSQ